MLTDVPLVENDSIIDMIATVNGNIVTSKKLIEGVYFIGHFSFNYMISISKDRVEEWPKLKISGQTDEEEWEDGFSCCGVCDHFTQILEQCHLLVDDPNRKFVISITPVLKENQSSKGGWRWHKWGPYIGTHEITTEYLYDEEKIDKVFCYHVYEILDYFEKREG